MNITINRNSAHCSYLFRHLISGGTFVLELIKSHFLLKISVTVFLPSHSSTVTRPLLRQSFRFKKNLKKGPSFALLITRPPTVARKNKQTNVSWSDSYPSLFYVRNIYEYMYGVVRGLQKFGSSRTSKFIFAFLRPKSAFIPLMIGTRATVNVKLVLLVFISHQVRARHKACVCLCVWNNTRLIWQRVNFNMEVHSLILVSLLFCLVLTGRVFLDGIRHSFLCK